MNLEINFKRIINPIKEFMVADEILKSERYTRLINEKIFSEITRFFEDKKGFKIKECILRGKKGKIAISSNYEYIIEVFFKGKEVEVFVNGSSIGTSTFFGAEINKANLNTSSIKIDLISFKKELNKRVK